MATKQTTSQQEVLDTALQMEKAGRSVLQVKPGTKYPGKGWTKYQTQRPTPAEIRRWFQDQDRGICLVTGKISGLTGPDGTVYSLEIIDFDETGLYEQFLEEAIALRLEALINRIPSVASTSFPFLPGFCQCSMPRCVVRSSDHPLRSSKAFHCPRSACRLYSPPGLLASDSTWASGPVEASRTVAVLNMRQS